MKKILLGLFAGGLLVANYSSEKEKTEYVDLTSQNISLLQANASEMWCDATNTQECTIGSAKATGVLYAKD